MARAESIVFDTSAQFAPLPAVSFVPRPVPMPAGTVAVRSPQQMVSPVEFVATGGLGRRVVWCRFAHVVDEAALECGDERGRRRGDKVASSNGVG